MEKEHWQFLLLTGIMLGLMLCFSLGARPKTRLYRWSGRIFWSAIFLQIAEAAGVMGMNGVNMLVICALGCPGAAALGVINLL